jgi:beta-carotene 15,15'-dioxygenase
MAALAGAAGLAALALLVWADTRVPQARWLLLIGLSVSTGFVHGALDAVLLQREFLDTRARAGAALAYLCLVLALAFVLAHQPAWALLLLLAMSVWHFGEGRGRWPGNHWMARCVAGGAPVMLPCLLAGRALAETLPHFAGDHAQLVGAAWQTMAWAWALLCIAGGVLLRREAFFKRLWVEVAAVAALFALLSPLSAFALYFGLFHSLSHIGDVAASHHPRRQGSMWLQPAVLATLGLSAALLLALWLLLPSPAQGWPSAYDQPARWLIVALCAVSLPHLALVQRCGAWLHPAPPAG